MKQSEGGEQNSGYGLKGEGLHCMAVVLTEVSILSSKRKAE